MNLTKEEQNEVLNKIERVTTIRLGGKITEAYNDSSLRLRVYVNIIDNIYKRFNVTTFSDIKVNNLVELFDLIENYQLPLLLANGVVKRNNCIS